MCELVNANKKEEINRGFPNHTQVERYDKLTTKICQFCVVKINEFVLFRKICASTDIRLRVEQSNVFDAVSSVDIIGKPAAVAETIYDIPDASIGDFSLADRGTTVTITTGTKTDMDSSDAEM